MKVSVAFGDKRVVVPCKDGTLSVRELIDEAVRRYRKTNALKLDSSCAILSSDNSDINVYGIESLDGAMYDLDDKVCDVADDKETLVALFHESVSSVPDCASSADGGNSSEHFTSSLTNTDHRLSSYSQSDTHQYSEVSRAKSEEILSQCNNGLSYPNDTSAVDVSVINNPSQDRHNYSFNSCYMDPEPSPMMATKHGILRGGEQGRYKDELTSNTSSVTGAKQCTVPLSHTDRDQHRLNVPNSAPNKDGSCPKPTVSMFRRTLGTEASPRLTTKANSDLVDRWLTSQMAKNATIGAAYQPTTISTDSNGAHEIDGGLNSAQATEGVTASGVSNVNGTSGSHGGGFDGSGSGQQSNSMYRVVNIINDNELLGIQVVAQYEKMKQPVATAENASMVPESELTAVKSIAVGLLVRHVNEGGKAHSQSLLFPGDLITEINGCSLYGMSFDKAQDVFKEALKTPSLSLRVVNATGSNSSSALSPPVAGGVTNCISSTGGGGRTFHQNSDTTSLTSSFCSPDSASQNAANFDAPQVSVRHVQANLNQNLNYPLMSGSATLPNRRSTGQNVSESCRQEVGGGNSNPVSANSLKTPGCSTADKTFLFESPLSLMNRANTKKIGRKIRVQLQKGPEGLGFSLTARDNSGPLNASSPVYIKKILKKGAAIQDGRLMEGDRLLEVNGTTVTGMSQNEVVAFLRAIPESNVADILVSRHEVEDVPREITECNDSEMQLRNNGMCKDLSNNEFKSNEDGAVTAEENRSVLSYVIPLNDTGSAGLGMSVKGRTQRDLTSGDSQDTGVFIKAILNGGAAWKDGQLRVNDQLLSVNEQSLMCMDNKDAIELLKNSLIHHGKTGQANFRVTVSRLKSSTPAAQQEGSQFGGSSASSSLNLINYPINSESLPRSRGDTGRQDQPRSFFEELNPNSYVESRSPGPRSRPDTTSTDNNSDVVDGGFSREDIHRRSLSEKRTGGRVRDANELAFYRERIKPMKDAAMFGDGEPSMRRAGSCDQILDAVVSINDDAYWLPKRKRNAMVLPESAAETLLLNTNRTAHKGSSTLGYRRNNYNNNNNNAGMSRSRHIPWAPMTPAGMRRNNGPPPGYYTAHKTQVSHSMDRAKSASMESLTNLGVPIAHQQCPSQLQMATQPMPPSYSHHQGSHAYPGEDRRSCRLSDDAPPPVQPRRNSNVDAPPIPARRIKPTPMNFNNTSSMSSDTRNQTVQFHLQRGVAPPSPGYVVRNNGKNKENSMGQKWTDSSNLSKDKKHKSSGGIFRGLFSPTSDMDTPLSTPILRPRSPSSNQRRRPPPSSLRTNKKSQADKNVNNGSNGDNALPSPRSCSAPIRPQSAMPPSAPSAVYHRKISNQQSPMASFQSEEPAAIFVNNDKMRDASSRRDGASALNANNMRINTSKGGGSNPATSPHRINLNPNRNSYHSPMSSSSPSQDISPQNNLIQAAYNSNRSSMRRDSNSSNMATATVFSPNHQLSNSGAAVESREDVAAAYYDKVYSSNMNSHPPSQNHSRTARTSVGVMMGFGRSSPNKNSCYATLPNHPNIKFNRILDSKDRNAAARTYHLNNSCSDIFALTNNDNISHKSELSHPAFYRCDIDSGDQQSDRSWSPMKENTYGSQMTSFYDCPSSNSYQSLPRKCNSYSLDKNHVNPKNESHSKNRYVKNRKSDRLEMRVDSDFEYSRRDFDVSPPTYGVVGTKKLVSEYSLGSHSSANGSGSEGVLVGEY